ncbi:MAG: acyltransferase [Clostridia bacterium]|nr:acyltransferase [Clostridia bacterium]
MKTARINYVDYAKAVGILLIVFAHCIQWFTPMSSINLFIISFHVPVFFIVSGCLACEKSIEDVPFITYLKKKSKSLLIPYIVFSLINSFLKLTVMKIDGSLTDEIVRNEMTELFITGNGTVWFLATLFFIYIAYYFIAKAFKNSLPLMFLISACLLAIPYVFTKDQGKPFVTLILRFSGGLGYFILGYLLRKAMSLFSKKTLSYISGALLIAGVAVYLTLGSTFTFFDGTFRNPAGSLGSSILISFAIIVFFYSNGNYIRGKLHAVLEHFGKNSLVVMLAHPIILNCVTYPFGKTLNTFTGAAGVLLSLLLYVVVVAVSAVCSEFISKKMPWMLGKY